MENFETAIAKLNEQHHVPQSIEFMVQEDFINNLPAIVSNLEQVEQWAIAQTESDRNLILSTEEDFEMARERCAKLNKQIKLIEDKRKEIKKAYNQPYDVFEKASKRVTSVLSTARESLWSQVTKAEDEQKEKKKARLKDFWDKLNGDAIGGYRTFEQIFDSKWLNKGTKLETACAEMEKIFKEIVSDIMAIRSLNSEFQVSLIEHYKAGHGISEVIAYNNRLIESKKQAEINLSWHSEPDPQLVKKEENLPQENAPIEETEEIRRVEFWVEGTPEKIKQLGQYIRENGLKYGKIQK